MCVFLFVFLSKRILWQGTENTETKLFERHCDLDFLVSIFDINTVFLTINILYSSFFF